MKFKTIQQKRQYVADKLIVGIDPGKSRHQAAIFERAGGQQAMFTFQVSYQGYRQQLWKKLNRVLPIDDFSRLVFAIETSCNLWQTLAHYLQKTGYPVLLVSPLTTHYSRPILDHDFSHTDPKDALLIAHNAASGCFDYYRTYSAETNALHELSIAYCKIRRSLLQQRARIRAFMGFVFPEFLDVVAINTATARYLLEHYFLPEHYIHMDIVTVGHKLETISNKQHGMATLKRLQEAARHTIGIGKSDEVEIRVAEATIQTWLAAEELLRQRLQKIRGMLIPLARKQPGFESINSLPGISELLAALFIAETRDLTLYSHYKQIEKCAGLNLRQRQSGAYVGRRRISKIGNKRLSWIIYWMLEQTSRSLPEVRIKYLRRQLHKPCHRKNLIACTTLFLRLVLKLVQENRPYQIRDEQVAIMKTLEKAYEQKQKKSQRKYPAKAA